MKGLRNLMMVGVFCLALGASSFAVAREDKYTGSIPVSGQHSQTELQNMAKINQSDARQKALDTVKGENATVSSQRLETRNGYLVYEFDIQVPGQSGMQMVVIDAGNGQVLKHRKEGMYHKSDKSEKSGSGSDSGSSGGTMGGGTSGTSSGGTTGGTSGGGTSGGGSGYSGGSGH